MAFTDVDNVGGVLPPSDPPTFSDGFVSPLEFIIPPAPQKVVPLSEPYAPLANSLRRGGDQSEAVGDMDVINPRWIQAQEAVRDTPPSGTEMYGGPLESVSIPDIGGGRFAPRSQADIDAMPKKSVLMRNVGGKYESPYAQPDAAAAGKGLEGIGRAMSAGQSALNILNVHADKLIPGPGQGTIYDRFKKYTDSGMDMDEAANKAMDDYGEALKRFAEDPNQPLDNRAVAQWARGLGLAENLVGDVTNVAAPGAGLVLGGMKKAGTFIVKGKKVINTATGAEHEFLSAEMAKKAAAKFEADEAAEIAKRTTPGFAPQGGAQSIRAQGKGEGLRARLGKTDEAFADTGPKQQEAGSEIGKSVDEYIKKRSGDPDAAAAAASLRKIADELESGKRTLPMTDIPQATSGGKVVEQTWMLNPASTKKGKFTLAAEAVPPQKSSPPKPDEVMTKNIWGDFPRTQQGAFEFENAASAQIAERAAAQESVQAAGREILESAGGEPPIRGQMLAPERLPEGGRYTEMASVPEGTTRNVPKLQPATFDLSDAATRAAQESSQMELKFPKSGIGSIVAKYAKEAPGEAMRVTRSIAASLDLSGILRQGGMAAVAHNPEWRKGVEAVGKSFDDAKFTELVKTLPERFDSYQLAKNSGIAIDESAAKLGGEKVEYFTSKLAEKIPGVKLSERAYVAMLNETRMNIFETYAKSWGLMETGGKTPAQLKHMERQAADLAQFVNSITGRGNLGALEDIAPKLNNMMFSPRFFASRINNIFAPFVATANALLPEGKAIGLAGHNLVEGGGDWKMAALAWRDMSAWTGVMASTLAMAKLSGADVGDDPSASDFGKIRVGNSFIDVTGGMGNLARTAYRLTTGEYKSRSGKKTDLDERGFGPDKKDVLIDYLRNVVSPNVDIGMSVFLEGNRDIAGNDLGVMGHIPTPLGVKDLWEAWQEDLKGNPSLSDLIEGAPEGLPRLPTAENQGIKGAALGATGMLGLGVQSYNPQAKAKKHSNNPIDVMLRELTRGSKKSNNEYGF